MGGGRRCGERESNRGQLGGSRSREREMRQSDGEREGESWEGGEVERGRCGERERWVWIRTGGCGREVLTYSGSCVVWLSQKMSRETGSPLCGLKS